MSNISLFFTGSITYSIVMHLNLCISLNVLFIGRTYSLKDLVKIKYKWQFYTAKNSMLFI
jgi:hypothetical protein